MRLETIANYTAEPASANTTHLIAYLCARRLGKWSWYNIRHWFKPPRVLSITLLPKDATGASEEFTEEMFAKNGFLYDIPLNHFVRIEPYPGGESTLINCAFLTRQFMYSESNGYAALKEIINLAKKEATRSRVSSQAQTTVSEESVENEEGSVRTVSRDASEGE